MITWLAFGQAWLARWTPQRLMLAESWHQAFSGFVLHTYRLHLWNFGRFSFDLMISSGANYSNFMKMALSSVIQKMTSLFKSFVGLELAASFITVLPFTLIEAISATAIPGCFSGDVTIPSQFAICRAFTDAKFIAGIFNENSKCCPGEFDPSTELPFQRSHFSSAGSVVDEHYHFETGEAVSRFAVVISNTAHLYDPAAFVIIGYFSNAASHIGSFQILERSDFFMKCCRHIRLIGTLFAIKGPETPVHLKSDSFWWPFRIHYSSHGQPPRKLLDFLGP